MSNQNLPAGSGPVHVLAFRVKNYMNIESAEVRLSDGTYEIYGDNADGKSAFMEAIVAAFSGKRGMVKQPIRKGAKQADWYVDTGDFTIERTLTATGSMKLTVTATNGTVYPHGQAFLDAFIDSLAFDPHSFSRMQPAKQAEVLRDIVGVDLDSYDAEIAAYKEKRLQAGRERDSLKGQLDGCTWHKDAPKSLVSVNELVDSLEKAQAHNATRQQMIDEAAQSLAENEKNISETARKLADARKEEERLQALVEAQKETISKYERQLSSVQAATASLKESHAAAKSLEQADENEVRQQLRNAQQVNAQVAENQRRQELLDRYQDAKILWEDYSADIGRLHTEKQEALAAAKFPVVGLSFDEAGVFYNDIPFGQLSTGQRIRIGAQLFFARKPKLNLILVRDASLLDKSNRAIIVEEATRHNAQVLFEVVGDAPSDNSVDKRSFTIVDGRVEFDGRE